VYGDVDADVECMEMLIRCRVYGDVDADVECMEMLIRCRVYGDVDAHACVTVHKQGWSDVLKHDLVLSVLKWSGE
jgi:cytoskeletal protein CcmA (bactofilin family)